MYKLATGRRREAAGELFRRISKIVLTTVCAGDILTSVQTVVNMAAVINRERKTAAWVSYNTPGTPVRISMNSISLSDSEWKIMKLLWEKSPNTLGGLTKDLEHDTGWTRATVFVMLKRLIAKNAVRVNEKARINEYTPIITREDLAPAETESFLDRVYDGSVEMLFSALTERKRLSDSEIAELRQILDNAEKRGKESK